VKHSAWATAALAVSATLVIAACGSSHSSASSSGTSSGTSSSATATTAAKFLGCMVTDTGGINDRSFNASSWAGMQAAAATSATSSSPWAS
jgi:basic membrane protein A and related proteins